jgi:hypothetical protein
MVGCGGGGGSDGASSRINPPPGNANPGTNPGSGSGTITISGTPQPTVSVDRPYSFQPVASSSTGATLTFTASNLPDWLTLEPHTGRISGTPSSADIGSYSITLTATDGNAQAQFGPFTITVVAVANGSATVSWTPPTQNSDGSALTDLAGFVIVYGQSPTQLNQTITIRNPSVTTYLVENLTSGTWYFAVQAENAAGVRSVLSETVSKRIG